MERKEIEKNSAFFWYPKIKDLVATPKTILVPIHQNLTWMLLDNQYSNLKLALQPVIKAANQMGYPCFVKTDQFSAKHSYKYSCFIPDSTDVLNHLLQIIEDNYNADFLGGPSINGFMVREFIQIDHKFKSFYGDLPIGKELRVFATDGKIDCAHYYWPEDAIFPKISESLQMFLPAPRPIDKEEQSNKDYLQKTKIWCESEGLNQVEPYVKIISTILIGNSWAIDFMWSNNEKFYMIDMQLANQSYHMSHD